MRYAALAFGLLLAPLARSERPAAPSKPCRLIVDNVDRYGTVTPMFGNNSSWDAGGNVRLHCRDQQVFLSTDSISVLNGEYVKLFGHAVYYDTAYRFTADTMVYVVRTELLQARSHVRGYDKSSGSTLVGPYVDYYRQVKGINDSARVVALLHPTVRYFGRAVPIDTIKQHPVVLSGVTLRGFGQSQLFANEQATIDRDSLHGEGDSLTFLHSANSVGYLYGAPARIRRLSATDSLLVLGKRIRIGLKDDRLNELYSYLDARVRRGESDVAGDTVRLTFTNDKLGLTQSWSHRGNATVHSQGFDISGDSLAIETPDEQLHEIRVFRRGIILSPLDSAHLKKAPTDSGLPIDSTLIAAALRKRAAKDSTPDLLSRNTLKGDRVKASFAQHDSAGQPITRLTGLLAIGRAASLYTRWGMKNGQQTQSVNYTQGDTISIIMRTDTDSAGVQLVNARGHVNGIQADSNESAFKKPVRRDSTTPPPVAKP